MYCDAVRIVCLMKVAKWLAVSASMCDSVAVKERKAEKRKLIIQSIDLIIQGKQ